MATPIAPRDFSLSRREMASRVSPDTVEKAVTALLKWKASKLRTQNPQLLPQDEFVYLVLNLKKIPSQPRATPHKISLPHSIHPPDSSEICLIIDDRSKSNLTKNIAKEKIQADNIVVSKILKISKLKTDYRPFEAKRKLCDSYDLFLTDKRVWELLPRFLGKQFFKKKKMPVPVNLKRKSWKEQVERVRYSGLLYLSTGNCCVVRVARESMKKEEIVSNVVAAIDGIADVVPRKWAGVRSLHLKLSESLALPIYQVIPDVKLKIDEPEENRENGGNDVKEGSEEKKNNKMGGKKAAKKGRIHEVRYMDNGVAGEDLVSSDEADDADVSQESCKKEDLKQDVNEGGEKEQKKRASMKRKALDGEKKPKKLVKVEKGDGEKKPKKPEKVEKGDGEKKKKASLSGKGREKSVGRRRREVDLGS